MYIGILHAAIEMCGLMQIPIIMKIVLVSIVTSMCVFSRFIYIYLFTVDR